jgi:dTDP-3,4-didehydro-2,6-dideoxy-alpha-D-glucose 3-reductase
MNKIRIVVMGCASIAQRLMIPAIKQLPEQFELGGIASRTIEKSKQFADMFGREPIVGYGTIIHRTNIDAIANRLI